MRLKAEVDERDGYERIIVGYRYAKTFSVSDQLLVRKIQLTRSKRDERVRVRQHDGHRDGADAMVG